MLTHGSRLAATAAALTLAAVPAAAAASAAPVDTTYSTKGAWTFMSAPRLHPPKLATVGSADTSALAGGDWLLGNFKNITLGKPFAGQSGPLILNQKLQPVWFRPISGAYVNNLAAQTFEGKPALSWWQGGISATGGTTFGEDVVVNQAYQTVATLKAAPGWVLTQHEMLIRGHDAWVTANSAVPTPFDGHTIIDSAVQEYDLLTGKLLLNWTASAHIPLSASHQPAPPFPGAGWDAYHVNSIQLLPNGKTFLVSMRDTWTAYAVDIKSGAIKWTIDGSQLPGVAGFQWQHDVELHPGGLITLFDDHFGELLWTNPPSFATPTAPSRGLELKRDPSTGKITFVRQYVVPNAPYFTAFQGNTDLLPNGNVVVGWGSDPNISEFSPTGKLLENLVMPSPDVSYRAYVTKWVGRPSASAMRGVAWVSPRKVTWVFASWNGATGVAAWKVLGGSKLGQLKKIAVGRVTGFETGIRLTQSYPVYRVQALDSAGHVLASSGTFTTKPPVNTGY